METQSKAEEYRRISLITNGRIPVSEESPVFNLFAQRREVSGRLTDGNYSEELKEYAFGVLYTIEDNIKEYLLL